MRSQPSYCCPRSTCTSFEIEAIKPEPAIYHQVVERLGCDASAIAMIGDTLEADALGPISQSMQGYHLQRNGITGQPGFASRTDFASYVVQHAPMPSSNLVADRR
ncbi:MULTISPECIES: HAD family hydrolase [Pseudomonadaceae]|uniref:HAD family hydrolase n=1 Tax=Pseudomonadaceae TaxID=135621 RepID=UPI001E5A82A3|nr:MULTISPECIES: HAD hydrolase-like protein [Pseudomonadaceae]